MIRLIIYGFLFSITLTMLMRILYRRAERKNCERARPRPTPDTVVCAECGARYRPSIDGWTCPGCGK